MLDPTSTVTAFTAACAFGFLAHTAAPILRHAMARVERDIATLREQPRRLGAGDQTLTACSPR